MEKVILISVLIYFMNFQNVTFNFAILFSGVYIKGDTAMCKQPRTPNSAPDTPQSQKSPSESPIHASGSGIENDCKELTVNLGEKVEKIEKTEKPFPMLAPDDPPYFPETWYALFFYILISLV